VTVLQEEARDARGARWVDALLGDMRFAFRYVARHKATTAIIVIVVALGVGANTVIFSTFQAPFLRPPPAVAVNDALARMFAQERLKELRATEPLARRQKVTLRRLGDRQLRPSQRRQEHTGETYTCRD